MLTAQGVPESAVAAQCDSLVRSMLGEVTVRSQPQRVLASAGQADRRYHVLGCGIEWELKAADGKLTQQQFDLLDREYRTNGVAGCGGVEELSHVLTALRHSRSHGRALGWLFVTLWAARGFRRTGKATLTRAGR